MAGPDRLMVEDGGWRGWEIVRGRREASSGTFPAARGEERWTRERGSAGSGSTSRSATPASSADDAGSRSRPTLRKWRRRHRAEGVAGLEARSHRPRTSPNRKVFAEQEALILRLRRERRLGIKMLRNELIRRHGLRLALDTIHKVLVRHGENRLERPKLRRKGTRRYSRPVPGDRVQMDTCKIAPGLYRYTAIDDCSRWQVIGLYPRRTAANTRDFLKHVLEEMPFPVQRVQTDRGGEFFAYEVQDDLRERHIKYRPNRPRAPHLNGKVERVQRTALEEFWPTVDPKGPDLATQLEA